MFSVQFYINFLTGFYITKVYSKIGIICSIFYSYFRNKDHWWGFQSESKRLKVWNLPWRKYRIEIHSESIRTIPIHSDICIRANLVWWKTVKIDPTQSDLIRGNHPNEFKPIWNQISIRINLSSDWSKPNF